MLHVFGITISYKEIAVHFNPNSVDFGHTPPSAK